MNAFAVRQLAVLPADRVLEIGFGGGVNLPFLIRNAALVVGLDRSRDVVERARARFSVAVKAGRAEFREGCVEALPFEEMSFNKVCTVNTLYFWRSLDLSFREIYRVLLPGGSVVAGFLPKEWMDRLGVPKDIFTAREPGETVAALSAAGFHNIKIERPEPGTAWNVVVAKR